jgi:hypothetical protein
MRHLLIIAVGIALILIAIFAQNAIAGIGADGYAQVAQHALNKAGSFYGYKTHCKATGQTSAHPNVRIVCIMTETVR